MREAILNAQDYDVHLDTSGEPTVMYTAHEGCGIEDDFCDGVIKWGPLDKRTRRDLAAAE